MTIENHDVRSHAASYQKILLVGEQILAMLSMDNSRSSDHHLECMRLLIKHYLKAHLHGSCTIQRMRLECNQ